MRRIILVMILAACASRPPRDFLADYQDCIRLEDAPSLRDHHAATKCLVDRFGWPVARADAGIDSILSAQIADINAQIKTIRDSIARDSVAWLAQQAAYARQLWDEGVAHAQWVGDEDTHLLYRTWPSCEAARSINRSLRRTFSPRRVAEDSGYTLNGYAGCGEIVPAYPGY